jgi:hypothetical protein
MRSITSLTDLTSLTSLTSRDRHRHGATATPAGGTRRRHLAVLSATALAAATLLAGNGAADAAISPGGGRNPDRTPVFLRDAQGLALRLCTDTVNCEPAAEAGEIGSYFSAEAELGPMRAIWGIDAAFLEDAADNITDRPALTSSALFRAEGLRPNRRYTIRGPWGTHRCTTDGQGQLTNKNCLFERGGEAGGALRGGPVKSFLRAAASPAGFVGSLEIPRRVTGSPSGFNRVTLTGPGANFRTNLIAVSGQLADNIPMAAVRKDSLRLGNKNKARPTQRVLRVRNVGTAPLSVRIAKSGDNPGRFRVVNNCSGVAPGRACGIEVTYRPRRNAVNTAAMTLTTNGLRAPQRVTLTGIGPS